MASEKELDELRAAIRQRAGQEATTLEGEFDRLALGKLSPPPGLQTRTAISGEKYRGRKQGEWDWHSSLSKAEKSRIKKNWTVKRWNATRSIWYR